MAARHGLGRGLNALIRDDTVQPPPADAPADELPLDAIAVNPLQPRDRFAADSLDELASSVKTHGILQPLLVRRHGDKYELVAGERRLRAARQAGLDKVPVRVLEAADCKSLELAMVENLQRADLNPMEEAHGYRRMSERFGLSQEEIAARVGKARATVANSMRLLDLPDEVRNLVLDGRLSAGHAKVLMALPEAAERCLFARRAVSEAWSVRMLEKAVARLQHGGRRTRRPSDWDVPPEHLKHLTDLLHHHFGTAVRIAPSRTTSGGRKIKGTLELDFYSNEDLNRLLDLFGVQL